MGGIYGCGLGGEPSMRDLDHRYGHRDGLSDAQELCRRRAKAAKLPAVKRALLRLAADLKKRNF